MSCDLEVDTALMRQAASLMRRAADGFRGGHTPHTYPSEHAAGATPEGREARRITMARTAQAVESAQLLSEASDRLADLLAAAADRFDAAEALCAAGG